MSVTLAVETGTDEERVFLVPRHEKDFAAIGTVAEVSDRIRLPGGARASVLNGLHRGVAGAAHTLPDGRLFVEVEERPDPTGGVTDGRTRQLEREYRAVVEEILDLRGDDGRVQAFLRSITEPGALADTSGYSPDLTYEQRVQLLQTVEVADRLELALGFQKERLAEMQVRKRIREDVESGAEKQQRDYFLRKQMSRSARSSARTTRRCSRSTGPRSPRPACRRRSPNRLRRNSAASSASASSRPSQA
jgi:ATP-dependent Lon protease